VLNPFLTEEDLLKRILQDFGVMSRDELKAGRLAKVTKQELIDSLYDFLLGLVPLKASAVLIIDEAQNLPLPVLEQIRILSNLETDKEKLLQIILVGQLDLQTLLRSPELRQLDQRVSIRYELKPLDQETVAAYVAHRLTIAGGSAAVGFTAKALEQVYRLSGGIPRLINLICDRALLAGFSEQTSRITPEMVINAAQSLDVQPLISHGFGRAAGGGASLSAAAAVVLLAAALGVGATALLYQRFANGVVHAQASSPAQRPMAVATAPGLQDRSFRSRRLPADAAETILVGSYPVSDPASAEGVRALTEWLEGIGFKVFYADADLGSQGHWQRVLAGAYTDPVAARRDVARLQSAARSSGVRLVTAGFATGTLEQ
jgi:general secretion pathway protein A